MASSWQRLAYVTNGSSTSTTMLDTANDSSFSGDDFTAKKHLRILVQLRPSSSGANLTGRFGNSSGINSETYYWRYNSNGGSDATGNSSYSRVGGHSYNDNGLYIINVPANIDGEDKLCFSHWLQGGSGTASRVEISFRSQISAPITRMQVSLEFGSTDMGAYSSILVLGADDQEDAPPNIPNGSVFITSDTNVHYMFNSSAGTWHEVA